MPLLRCRQLQAGGPVPLRALSHPIPELGGRGRAGPSLTQFGDPSRAALRLESLTPGSLLPSLRFGVTLSSLRVRYAPFGESPRVLPRSGSSLSQPLRESERLARDGDDDTVHVKQALVCVVNWRRSGSSLGVGGSAYSGREPLPSARRCPPLCARDLRAPRGS